MFLSFTQIIAWLTTYKYLLLFPIVVVEGPIITVIAGWLSSLGYFNLSTVYLIVVLGDMTGDSIYYLIGRKGGMRFLNKWGHYLRLNAERVERFKDHFHKHTARTIILGKFAHSIEIPFMIGAGLAHVPYGKFFIYILIPTVLKSLLFILIGYYFGQSYAKINTYLDYTALITVGVAVMLVLIYITVNKIGKKYGGEV